MDRLISLLREEIVSGRLRPGTRLPSDRELAGQYGVAPGTVALAMSNLAHEGLITRSRGRGSFVSKELPAKDRRLGFVRLRSSFSLQEPGYDLSWIEGLSQAAERRGWIPRWHYLSQDDVTNMESLTSRFVGTRGVITCLGLPGGIPSVLHVCGVPVVAVWSVDGGVGEGPRSYPQISFDRKEAARLATQHLLSLGYTRIGYIGEHVGKTTQRISGFLQAMRAGKMNIEAKWVLEPDQPSNDLSDLRERIRQLLRGDNWPEAFCCSTLDEARAVEMVARDHGLRVPEDVAAVACDDGGPPIAGLTSITTVGFSLPEVCEKALEVFEQAMARFPDDYGELIDPIMMPLHLTIRDSCGARLKGLASTESRTSDAGEEAT